MSADGSWPTHAPPRITELTFARALAAQGFEGVGEVWAIWRNLLAHGIDPSYALGQSWVEGNFGTNKNGWDRRSAADGTPMHSWAYIIWDNTLSRDVPGVFRYAASNGFEYTGYPDWATGAEDYARLLDQYRDRAPDDRYGPTDTIYGATAKWPAKALGSPEHLAYLAIVLDRMDLYDGQTPAEADVAILEDQPAAAAGKHHYRVRKGERWYDKSDLGARSHTFGADALVGYRGLVDGAGWAAIRLGGTTVFVKDGANHPATVYVPFDPARLTA